MKAKHLWPGARTFLSALAATLGTTFTAAFAAELGDPAASLDITDWVKGEAVDLAAAKGKKVVVVEFWATWCGPCRTSIPHLTELQKKFADRDVVIVGVSDEDASKVRPFVDQMGDKMDYTVAVDNNRQTSQGYMRAYGINGIPHAFVVDRDGRIAWHGHPMDGLDKILEKVAAAPATTASKPASPSDKKRAEAMGKLRAFSELAAAGAGPDKLDPLAAELVALDKEIGGIQPGRTLNLVELRRSARFQALTRDYQRAAAAGKSEAELRKIEDQAKPFAPPGYQFSDLRGQAGLQRLFQDYYRAVTGSADAANIEDLTRRLENAGPGEVEVMNEIAWTLLTDDRIKTRDLKLALKFSQAAVDATGGKDPDVLDIHARALFDNGKPNEAITQVKRAIELCDDKDKRQELGRTLKRYESGSWSK